MADGQILIDTRIRTDEVKQDTANLKKQLESLADSASASAKKIDRSFDNLSIDDAAEGLGESFEQEARKVEPIPEEIEKDFSKIDLEDVADGLGDGFEEEADKVKRESEKTETAVESLTDRISRQERELDNLKTAYVNARHEYGETADETQKLAREIEDLSRELAQSKREFVEAAQAADSFDRSLNDIDPLENFDAFFTGITAGITESALDLLGELGEAFVDLGVYAIEAGAEVQAANAQFEQTFKGIEEVARSTLKTVSDETGISATRMQTSFTKMFAFVKAVGGETEESMDIAARATRLAADNAAYFDKSIEDATETVYSFIKGNYENDAALNLVANEMARNTAAYKRYGKSFKELTALQQVDTLLAMAEAASLASGAYGQAAKEAGAWANTTGELNDAWKQFMAIQGQELTGFFTPVLQFFTNQLQEYVELRNQVRENNALADDISDVGVAAESSAESVSQLTEEEQALAMATEEAAIALSSALEEMSAQYEAAAQAAYDSMLSQIGYFDEISDESSWTAEKIVENWKKQQEAFTRYNENLEKAVEMNLPDKLVEQLSDGSQESMQILDALVNSYDVGIDEIIEAFESMDEARTNVAETTRDITTDIAQSLEGLAEQIAAEYNVAVDDVLGQLAELQGAVNGLYGKDIYINVITQSKTLTSGAVAGAIAGTGNLIHKARSIPYLASGAVIPPNAPFTAVLGDQKHGTNIEAPLATIQEAVAQVIGDLAPAMAAGFETMVEEQRATRAAIEDIQIGDTTIGRAAARYDRRQNLIRGGATG